MPDPKVQIVITADGSQAGREVTKAGAELTKLGVVSVTVGNLFADLGRRALDVGKDLARFPLDAAVATGRYVDQLQSLTAETGLAAEEQQAYDVVLNRAGLGLQDLSGIWRQLSQNVIAARDPMSDAALKFRQLGIELNGSEGPNEVLQLVAERLAALPDGFQKNALATELLGRSGARFLPAFKEGLAGAAVEAKRLGTVLDSEARAKAAAFDDATDDLHKAWEGLTHQIGVLAAPVLTDLARNLTEATAKTSQWAAELGGAKKEAEGLSDVVRRMGPGAAQMGPSPTLEGGGRPRGTAERPSQEVLDALGLIEAQDHAARAAAAAGSRQESLGRAGVRRTQQMLFDRDHMAEQQPGLAASFDIDQVQARERFAEKAAARPDMSGLTEMQRGLLAIRELMPELDANEAFLQMTHNVEAGNAAVVTAVDEWRGYRDGLADAAQNARGLEAAQAALFQTEAGFIGAVDTMRRLSFERIDAEEAQKRQQILDTFGESERGQQKLIELETESATQRMNVIRQYPDFWEQQLQAVINSNAFSVGSIVSTWTGGLAQAAVHGESFSQIMKSAWQSTQVAVLQAGLNMLVQWGAQLALAAARDLAVTAATEAGKTAMVTAGAAARTGAAAAEAAATGGIYEGMATVVFGALASVQSATIAFMMSAWTVLLKIGNFIVGLLSAIAAAMKATIFGIPVGLLIAGAAIGLAAYLASQGQIMAAVGVGLAGIGAGAAGLGFFDGAAAGAGGGLDVSTVGFAAEGGIFDRPTLTMIAEANDPELAIPLNARGKRFLNQLGFGGAGSQHIVFQVGDDVLVEKVLRGMPRMVRMKVGGAF